MHYITGILLVATCVCSALALPPCTCTRNYKPVCGSDGNTYSNECILNCERHNKKQDLTVVKEGSCEVELPVLPDSNCVCTYEYSPVCGSDGTTYPNKCSLGCARSDSPALEMKHSGRCKREAVQVAALAPCMCTREMKPVCGSDGNTYSNPCMLNCATQADPTLSVRHIGPCEDRVQVVDQPEHEPAPSCACTRNFAPVCGSDGTTYSNPCLLNCATQADPTLSMRHAGPCEDRAHIADHPGHDSVPSCACTRNLAPVCGSDGTTYNNPCLLNCATQSDPNLSIRHSGPCEVREQVADQPEHNKSESCACTRDLKPVCASDGHTYNNLCLMRCQGRHLTVVHQKPCQD